MNWTQADRDRGPTGKQPGRTECGPTGNRSNHGSGEARDASGGGQSRGRSALGTVPGDARAPEGKRAPFERLYRVPEVAELFGVAPETVRDWLAQGVLRGGNLRKGGTVYVKESELARAMQRIGS